MKTVEFTKEFLTGNLKGIKVVERLTTDHPEDFFAGRVYREFGTRSKVKIIHTKVD